MPAAAGLPGASSVIKNLFDQARKDAGNSLHLPLFPFFVISCAQILVSGNIYLHFLLYTTVHAAAPPAIIAAAISPNGTDVSPVLGASFPLPEPPL